MLDNSDGNNKIGNTETKDIDKEDDIRVLDRRYKGAF